MWRMAVLVQVQMNLVFAILLIVLFLHAYFNFDRKKTTNRLFMWILALTWFVLVTEIFSVVVNVPNLKELITLNKIVNIIGFIMSPVVPFLGYMFIKEWPTRFQKEKIKVNNIIIIPLIINGIITAISYNGGWVFRITGENIYERGPLFFIFPCICFMYVGFYLYFIYKHRSKFNYAEVIIFSSFFIVPTLATIFQLIYPVYLSTWKSIAIVSVITYIFIINDQAYRDSLTGLGNRLAYEQFSQNSYNKKMNKLFIVYIDIDDFKNINDSYGHYEGDVAIKLFANLLRKAFPLKQRKIIRLGGDEFLIFFKEQQKEVIESYIQNLDEQVKVFNKSGEKPYSFSFSYGVAGYPNDDENESIAKLLEHADQRMYKYKQKRKNAEMNIESIT